MVAVEGGGGGVEGGAGLSKQVDHQGWPTTKNALKPSPKNGNLDQNINDSKISYLEFFFWKYSFGHTKFLYLPRRSSGYNQSFFNFRFSSRKSQSQQKVAKKITHTFYNTVLLKNTSLILRTSAHLTLKVIFSNTTFLTLQILQTCFCLVSEQIFVLHHFLTPKNCILEAHWKKMSVYFFISP